MQQLAKNRQKPKTAKNYCKIIMRYISVN